MSSPALDDDLGFSECVEHLAVEQLVTQLAVEAFAVAVLPRAAGLDVERLCSELCEPATHDLGRHLSTVVGADVFRHAAFEHHVGHRLDDAKAVDATGHPDGQAFPSELINQGHQSDLAPIVGLRLDEVVAPDMIAMLRP